MPSFLTRLTIKLQMLFGRRKAAEQLNNELSFHIEQQIRENIATGMSRAEARNAALRAFGNPILLREQTRATWPWNWIENLFREARMSVRMLMRSPGFAATAILTLALGIGANTAMFTLVNLMLLHRLPMPEPERLISLSTYDPAHPGLYAAAWPEGFTFPAYLQLAREQRVFPQLVAYEEGGIRSIQSPNASELGNVMSETGDFFSLAGVPALLGRWITSQEDGSVDGQREKVAVISYRCWQSLFGGAPNVIGKTLLIDGDAFTIVGVMPRQFIALRIDSPPEVIIPLKRPVAASRDNYPAYQLIARLPKDATLAQAATRLQTLWKQVKQASAPTWLSGSERSSYLARRVALSSLATGFMYSRELYRKPLLCLWGLVVLLLVIACANLGTMLLARAIARQRDSAIRAALGASRLTLLRQTLLECLMLGLCGALPGLAIAFYASRWLARQFWESVSPMDLKFTPDAATLAFALGSTLATVMLFGIVPAWMSSRSYPGRALQAGSRSIVRQSSSFLGKTLLAGQIAFSLILLMIAGQLVFSARALLRVDVGMETTRVLDISLIQRGAGYKNFNPEPYYRSLQEQVAQIPGVASAGMGNITLFYPGSITDKVATLDQKLAVDASYARPVTPGFFAGLGIPLESGRDFRFSDDTAHPAVAIVNRSLAARLFPHNDAVGQHVHLDDAFNGGQVEVIGVVADANLDDPRRPALPAIYIAFFQHPGYMRNPEILLRIAGDASEVQRRVRTIVSAMGREDIWGAQMLQERLNHALRTERMLAVLAGLFGLLALVLSGIGIAGLFSCLVAQRRSEIGLRMALGAQREGVLAMILRQACAVVLFGSLAGIPLAWIATRLLHAFLYRSMAPAVDMAAAWLALTAAGLLAASLPAWRASRLDPMQALRTE